MAAEPPGPLLARGRAADVFDLGEGRVLRRYRLPASGGAEAAAEAAARAQAEADVMTRLRAAGYPTPRVLEVRGGDLLMQRIEGPTMLQDLARRPWRVLWAADVLAKLHLQLHAIPGDGGSILHLDLHPENVILSPAGPVVIDWTNFRTGPAEVDVAQTWVIVATSAPDREAGPTLRLLLLGRELFLRRFLRSFDRAAVLRQLPAVCEMRLDDRNVTDAEREQIRAFLGRVAGSR